MPSVAILGASKDRQRFSNKAVRAYLQAGYSVYPVNPKEREIEGLKCYGTVSDIPAQPDKALFYVNPGIGIGLVEGVARKGIKTIYLNPGAESPELAEKARGLGLEVVQACAIVAIGRKPSEF